MCAVSFFIILSGASSVIASYGREISCSLGNIFAYMKKKIVKMYPLYFVTTICAIIESPIPSAIAKHNMVDLNVQLLKLAKNLFLIQSWFPTHYFSFDGVGWFLSTIMFLYLFNVPLKTVAARICKSNYSVAIFIIIVFISYYSTLGYCYLTRDTHMQYTQFVLPISRLGEYVCGISIGYLICLSKQKLLKNKIETVIFTVLEALVILLWIFKMYTPMQAWHFRTVHWIMTNIFLIFIFGIGRGKISSFFKIKYLRYLGNISFECFLLHPLVLSAYRRCVKIDPSNKVAVVFFILFCLYLVTMIASLISKCKYKKMIIRN